MLYLFYTPGRFYVYNQHQRRLLNMEMSGCGEQYYPDLMAEIDGLLMEGSDRDSRDLIVLLMLLSKMPIDRDGVDINDLLLIQAQINRIARTMWLNDIDDLRPDMFKTLGDDISDMF